MDSDFMDESLICKPKKNGGLGLMLPGVFFDMTNIIAKERDTNKAFELYHKERKKFKAKFTEYGLNFANRALVQYN